jgi:NTP pyrophosphatase (non-canonical NTP hydrolase)
MEKDHQETKIKSIIMTIQEIQKRAFQNSTDKGWHEEDLNVPVKLCLIHSEVSEAMEADRKNRFCTTHEKNIPFSKDFFEESIKDTFADELADVVIRVCDLAEAKGIDLGYHIEQKMTYNDSRKYKHGGKKY